VAPGGQPIASIGGATFGTAEMEQRIRRQSSFMQERYSDLEVREKFVRNELRFELLAVEGWQRKLYEDPQIVAELKKAIVQRVIRDEQKRIEAEIQISAADLQAGYEASKSDFVKPEQIRLSIAVRYVKTEAERAAAHRRLEKAMQEVFELEKKNVTGGFYKIAQDHSEDEASRSAGGSLAFMDRETLTARWGEAVARAVFEQADVGDMMIGDAENAVVLFKKTGVRRAVNRSLEQVRPQVRNKILQERRNAAFETFLVELEKRHGVSIDRAAIEAMQIPAAAEPSRPSPPPKPESGE
jgi:hypothetical protein